MLRLALAAAVCFTLATLLEPRAMTWGDPGRDDNALKLVFGEGRRLFANHFFIQADVSFHSGYYPSIFDQANRPKASPMVSPGAGPETHDGHGDHPDEDESAHAREMAFLRQPKDWIERFGRHFLITEHTHLSGGQEREILPWLKLSAELDPQRIQTYTVAAYWLRVRLGKVKEAEEFLREGLRHNPDSYQILFELGRAYYENDHDPDRARNVWELALKKWDAQEARKKQEDQDLVSLAQIVDNLAHLEEAAGHYERAIELLERGKAASPHPADLEAQIAELRAKIAARTTPR
jgi:tetratricopeptide (TPR) repeat protein